MVRSGRGRGKEWKRAGQEGVEEGGSGRSGRGRVRKEWKRARQEREEEDGAMSGRGHGKE